MKKKLFPLIYILILVILFGTAATCNMCGLNLSTETTASTVEESQITEGQETTKTTTGSDTTKEKTTGTTKSSSTGTQTLAPTIKLQIYEGPTYSQTDSICYYRIEAIVTGNPTPTITFSKDDSSGAFGSKKVQVNLTKGSPNYTLTAKAKNSAGENTASIDLSWGCGTLVEEKTVNFHPIIIGTVGPGGFIYTTNIAIGDSVFDTDWRGRFAFDVSSLAGKEIKYAKLTLANPDLSPNPCNFKGNIVIYYNDFLAGGFTGADYWSPAYAGPEIFPWDAALLEFSTDFLKTKVAERANAHLELQFGIGYENTATGGLPNVELEGRVYNTEDITLTVNYNE